jgi:hypothetical protein
MQYVETRTFGFRMSPNFPLVGVDAGLEWRMSNNSRLPGGHTVQLEKICFGSSFEPTDGGESQH